MNIIKPCFLHFSLALGLIFSVSLRAATLPDPSVDFLYNLKQSLVKIGTTTKNGGHGFGTGVAISKEHVVTNCHVINNANGISITKWGSEYPAESLQADWKHDLCILRVQYADLKPIAMADSSKLSYEQQVISISMPADSPAPFVALSTVKALYPFDNDQVIRTQAAFAIGASGSPVFDYNGELIAISTFKSPGKNAYYYNMPINLVKSLMLTESVRLNSVHESPFWDAAETDRPFFMQIVMPYQNKRWQDVQVVANNWVAKEPKNAEAWYYMGRAAQNLGDLKTAKLHYQKVLALQPNHPSTLQTLALIANNEGKQEDVDKIWITLKEINPQLLEELGPTAQDLQNPDQYRF
jgi:tetratricopeptide (TPR) repeat protein